MSLTSRNAIELLIENVTSISLILINGDHSAHPSSGLLRLVDLIKKSTDGILRNVVLTIRALGDSKVSEKVLSKCSIIPPRRPSSTPDLNQSDALLELVESVIDAADANFNVFRRYIVEKCCEEDSGNGGNNSVNESAIGSAGKDPEEDVVTLKSALTNGYLYVEKAFFLVVFETQLQLHSFIENVEWTFSTIHQASTSDPLSQKEFAIIARAYYSLVTHISTNAQNLNWTQSSHTDLTSAITAIQENLPRHIESAQKGECDVALARLREQVEKVINTARSAFSANCVFPGIPLMFEYPVNEEESSIAKHLDVIIGKSKTLYEGFLSNESDVDISDLKREIEGVNDAKMTQLSPVASYLFELLKSAILETQDVDMTTLGKIYLTAFSLRKSVFSANDKLVCAYLCIFTIISVNSLKRSVETQAINKIKYLLPNFVSVINVTSNVIRTFVDTHPDPLYKTMCIKNLDALEEIRVSVLDLFGKAEMGDFERKEDIFKLLDQFLSVLKSLSLPCYWVAVLADTVLIDCDKIEQQDEECSASDDENCRMQYFKVFLIDITQKVTREVKFLNDIAEEILKTNTNDKTFVYEGTELLKDSKGIMTSFVSTAMAYITAPDDAGAKKEFIECMNRIRQFVQRASFIFRPTTLSISGSIVKLFKEVLLEERLAEFDDREICKSIIYNDNCEIVNFVRRLIAADEDSGLTAETVMLIKLSCLTKIAVNSPASTEQFIERLVMSNLISPISVNKE